MAYIDFPGTAGNFCSVPDEAALDVTGDITIVTRVAPDDWTSGANQAIVSKWETTGSQWSFVFLVGATGTLVLFWSANGSDALSEISTASPTISDGDPLWVAATLDVNNGSAGRDTRFWTSSDGASWTQLGSTVTQAGTTSIFAGTSELEIGIRDAEFGAGTLPFDGKISHVSIRDGIGAGGAVGGTEVFLFDGPRDLGGVDLDADDFEASTGQTVTVNRDGDPSTQIVRVASGPALRRRSMRRRQFLLRLMRNRDEGRLS